MRPVEKVVMAVLSARCGADSWVEVGVRALASACEVPVATLLRTVRSLERGGLLEVDRSGRLRNRYRTTMSSVIKMERAPFCEHQTSSSDLSLARAIGPKGATASAQQNKKERTGLLFEMRNIGEDERRVGGIRGKGREKGNLPMTNELDVYNAYPRKVGKKVALASIGRAILALKARGQENAADWLLERVKTYAASPAGQRGTFTPHPATWFNQGRYDDDDREWQRTEGDRGRSTAAGPAGRTGRTSERIVVRKFDPNVPPLRDDLRAASGDGA